MTIDQPLRLATGSHKRGSGKGCAMNVISWENGDTQITDFPSCSDPMLARIVPAFSGTDLHKFECTLCDHVLKKLGACGDWRGPGRL